jgi:hypothetical protein
VTLYFRITFLLFLLLLLAIPTRALGSGGVPVPVAHEIQHQEPAVDAHQAAPAVLGAPALGVRLPEALQGIEAGRLVNERPPDDAGASRPDPAVPPQWDRPACRRQRAHVQLRNGDVEFERRGHE